MKNIELKNESERVRISINSNDSKFSSLSSLFTLASKKE